MIRLFGYTFEWLDKGYRPNYRRDPFIGVIRYSFSQCFQSMWIGEHIRIGRTK